MMAPISRSVQERGGLIQLPPVPVTRAFSPLARLTVDTS